VFRTRLPAVMAQPQARPGYPSDEGREETRTLRVQASVRRYLVHTPMKYTSNVPMPLILALHPYGQGPEAFRTFSGLAQLADRFGLIVVFPEGVAMGPSWDIVPGERELAFLSALLDHVSTRYPVDHRRIYVIGFSNGAGMAHRFTCYTSERIAGLGVVAGTFELAGDCPARHPVPVIAIHGLKDQVAPYGGQGEGLPPIPQWAAAWARRNHCASEVIDHDDAQLRVFEWSDCSGKASVKLYVLKEAGHIWPIASRDALDAAETIWQFLAMHSLPD